MNAVAEFVRHLKEAAQKEVGMICDILFIAMRNKK